MRMEGRRRHGREKGWTHGSAVLRGRRASEGAADRTFQLQIMFCQCDTHHASPLIGMQLASHCHLFTPGGMFLYEPCHESLHLASPLCAPRHCVWSGRWRTGPGWPHPPLCPFPLLPISPTPTPPPGTTLHFPTPLPTPPPMPTTTLPHPAVAVRLCRPRCLCSTLSLGRCRWEAHTHPPIHPTHPTPTR